ncbi:thiol-activated cytolysin family protein [Chitinophaga pendula]|uniref:thiol-activated cytolysin family protein n=1 Tax=Chitinophaga TaxID=79328 RepID=UPI0012FDB73E|nr:MULTISPECIES: thiol-activated cytolysin family protein [Chitinophaga]UCJ07259.1 thiol-activated cytolysin family protein [Chitinophaga pendula]
MSTHYKLVLGVAAILLATSCQKKEKEAMQATLSGQALNAFRHLPKYPQQTITIDLKDQVPRAPQVDSADYLRQLHEAQQMSGDPLQPLPVGTLGYVNPIKELINWDAGSYSWQFEANEHVVYSDYEDQIYPGALIKGNSVANFAFNPVIGYTPKPIKVSVSLPAPASKVAATINAPSYTSMVQTVNNVLLNSALSGGGASKFNFNTKEFTYYDELKEFFASSVNTNAIFFNTSSSGTTNIRKISKRTGLMAKFIQKNFTIDMDIPKAGELIDLNVDQQILGNYAPVYVSSVTYGRLGIITVESDADFEQLNQAFKKAFGILGIVNGTNTLTQDEINLINAADIKVYLVGGDGAKAVQTINGYQNFLQYLGGGQTFTPQTPGVPISFSLRYLSDHSACKAQFQVNYGPISRTYARFEYRNQTYPMKWGYAPEQNGVIVGTMPDLYADVHLAFYQDASCTMPVKAYNFVKYNYQLHTLTIEIIPAPVSGGVTNTYDKGTRQNDQKGTSIYMGNILINSLDEHVTSKGVVTERTKIYRTYSLLPGEGYIIVNNP